MFGISEKTSLIRTQIHSNDEQSHIIIEKETTDKHGSAVNCNICGP